MQDGNGTLSYLPMGKIRAGNWLNQFSVMCFIYLIFFEVPKVFIYLLMLREQYKTAQLFERPCKAVSISLTGNAHFWPCRINTAEELKIVLVRLIFLFFFLV